MKIPQKTAKAAKFSRVDPLSLLEESVPQVYKPLIFCNKIGSIWYFAQWNVACLAVAWGIYTEHK